MTSARKGGTTRFETLAGQSVTLQVDASATEESTMQRVAELFHVQPHEVQLIPKKPSLRLEEGGMDKDPVVFVALRKSGGGAGASSKKKGEQAPSPSVPDTTVDEPPPKKQISDGGIAEMVSYSLNKDDVVKFVDSVLSGSEELLATVQEEFEEFLVRLLAARSPSVVQEARKILINVLKESEKVVIDGEFAAECKDGPDQNGQRGKTVSFGAESQRPESKRQSVKVREMIMDRQATLGVFKDSTPAAALDLEERQRQDMQYAARWNLFHWLDWAPPPGSLSYKTLHEFFPGALPGIAVQARVANLLVNEHGFTPDNTLFGLSICPDEINNRKGGLANLMAEFWGEVFPFGGISGAPFVGKTGFSAFSHHVPDDGHILILYGPHVSVSEAGDVGKYLREGQTNESTACGAVIGAYNSCCGLTEMKEEDFDEADMQMAWIKSQLLPHHDRIAAQPNPYAALAYQAFEMVRSKMNKIVNTKFGSGKLALVGGIQINMPLPYSDHFLPLSFEMQSQTSEQISLMDAFQDMGTRQGKKKSYASTTTSPSSRSGDYRDRRPSVQKLA